MYEVNNKCNCMIVRTLKFRLSNLYIIKKGSLIMTKEVCAYLAVSVDGFIADKDESVQFLEEVKGEGG